VSVAPMPHATVGQLVSQFTQDTAAFKSKSYQSCEGTYARIVTEVLGDRLVVDIRPRDIRALLHRIAVVEGHAPNANRLRTYCVSLFRHAEIEDMRPAGSNPAAPLKRYKETPKQPHLKPDERLALVRAAHECFLAEEISLEAGFLLLLMMYAGLRWSDASLLRWDEVFQLEHVIRLHPRGELRARSKADGVEIPICDDAVNLIRSMPRNDTPWVAPNRKTGKPYTQIKDARAKVYERAGISKRGYHLLRRTTGTAAAEAGCSLPQIAKILGQKSIASTEKYVKLAGKPAVDAANRMQAALLGGGREGGYGEGKQDGEGGGGGGHRRAGTGQDALDRQGDEGGEGPGSGTRRRLGPATHRPSPQE
jgi:integrase